MSSLYTYKTADEREKYKVENKTQIKNFEKVVEVINRYKKADGTLLK